MKIRATIDKVNQALSKIRSVGQVSINGTNGSFSAKGVEGRFSYDTESEVLTIVIDDKPFFASSSMIENEIKKFFN